MAEKKIGSRTFAASKMPATEGVRNLVRLTKLVGPGLPKLAGILSGPEAERDINALTGIVDILVACDTDEMTDFVVSMVERAEVQDGSGYRAIIADHDFQDLGEMLQVAAFVLRENYADFFGGSLGGVLRSAQKGPAKG